jgi:hypothetical protein
VHAAVQLEHVEFRLLKSNSNKQMSIHPNNGGSGNGNGKGGSGGSGGGNGNNSTNGITSANGSSSSSAHTGVNGVNGNAAGGSGSAANGGITESVSDSLLSGYTSSLTDGTTTSSGLASSLSSGGSGSSASQASRQSSMSPMSSLHLLSTASTLISLSHSRSSSTQPQASSNRSASAQAVSGAGASDGAVKQEAPDRNSASAGVRRAESSSSMESAGESAAVCMKSFSALHYRNVHTGNDSHSDCSVKSPQSIRSVGSNSTASKKAGHPNTVTFNLRDSQSVSVPGKVPANGSGHTVCNKTKPSVGLKSAFSLSHRKNGTGLHSSGKVAGKKTASAGACVGKEGGSGHKLSNYLILFLIK